MGEFLKIGGKYVDNQGEETAKGISVNQNGLIEVVRHNETKVVEICTSVAKRDTDNIPFYGDDAIDLSEWTTCSILVANTLDSDNVNIRFFSQFNKAQTGYLRTYDGSSPLIPLRQVDSGCYLITPDDVPLLNYLRYFTGRIEFGGTAPTTGSLSVSVILKR